MEIQDTGIGIATEDLVQLFKRFYRGRNAQQYDAQGSGLGLAIVKEIIELHTGTIEVKSQLGVGSTFILRFPIMGD